MSEELLEELGAFRVALPVPFPAAGGPVNVYAFEDEGGGLALFDAGIKSAEGERALREGLAARGRSFAEVRRIFISHGHIDHFGLAPRIRAESGCAIHVHPLDAPKVLEASRHLREGDAYAAYLARLGLDAAQVSEVRAGASYAQRFADGLDEVQPLHGGEKLRFARCELEVLHLPGHTPGLVCLWEPARRVLFADDHLLEKVSPNPLLELGPEGEAGKFRALSTYLESARRAQRLPAQLVCPGHGAPFSGHAQLIDRLLGFYEKRQAKILDALAQPRTALELVAVVFGQVRPGELFLQLSEVVGNLEVLEDAGRLRRDFDGRVYRYTRAS